MTCLFLSIDWKIGSSPYRFCIDVPFPLVPTVLNQNVRRRRRAGCLVCPHSPGVQKSSRGPIFRHLPFLGTMKDFCSTLPPCRKAKKTFFLRGCLYTRIPPHGAEVASPFLQGPPALPFSCRGRLLFRCAPLSSDAARGKHSRKAPILE